MFKRIYWRMVFSSQCIFLSLSRSVFEMLLSWNLVTASFQLMVSNRQIEFGISAANAHGILSSAANIVLAVKLKRQPNRNLF